MNITIAGDAITYRPDDDNLSGLNLEFAAFDGEVGTGQAPVPDPTAAISYYDGRAFVVEEGSTLLTDGFIIDQDRDRGPMPVDPARVHTFSVMDANALLDGFRVERTRPSETDYARVLAFAAADGPSWDTTFVVNSETVTMPKKTYSSDGGWTSELIPDLVDFTGKTLFLHDKTDGSGRCLHYHNLVSGHTCGLSISDQTSNGPTVWNPWSPRRQRTSVDLRNDIKMRDQAGRTSTVTDTTSISRHDADGLQHQALVNADAVSQGDLDIKAAAMLASLKDERDTYTCAIGPLDETALLAIRVGDLITVTSSVMGLTASVQRISHMTLHPWIGEGGRVVEGYWLAELEMGAPVRRRNRRRPVTFTDEPFVCTPVSFTVPWAVSGGKGSCIVPPPSGEECHSDDASMGGLGGNVATMYDGDTYRVDYTVYHSTNSNDVVGAVVPTTGTATAYGSHNFGGSCPAGATSGVYTNFASETITPSTGAMLGFRDFRVELTNTPFVSCGYPIGVSIEAGITWISGTHDPRFTSLVPGACSNGEPRVGQRVDDTASILGTSDGLGDGTTTDFTATFPFDQNSLNIFCNGLDWTLVIDTQDADAGTFTMLYPFPLGSTVRIIYRRAA